MYNFLWLVKNLSHFLVHIFESDLVFEGKQSMLLKSEFFYLSSV